MKADTANETTKDNADKAKKEIKTTIKPKTFKVNLKGGDKVVLISPMMQTCVAEFVEQDNDFYYVKNPLLFAAFPERDKENPNIIRNIFHAPSVWNRGVMSDVNQDQMCAFPKGTYGIMYAKDDTNAPLFSTDVLRLYNSAWAKTDKK